MKPIPTNWILVEEHEGSSVFENNDQSFNVYIDFNEKLKLPYAIGYEQMEGDYELIDFGEDTFTTTAGSLADALNKAILLMNFIDIKINGTEDEAQDLMA